MAAPARLARRFFEVRNEFYKDSQGGILVYDVTSRKSFEALDMWLKEAEKFGARNVTFCVCANKTDKATKRVVSERDGRAWAERNGFMYFETSAQSGENINEMVRTLHCAA